MINFKEALGLIIAIEGVLSRMIQGKNWKTLREKLLVNKWGYEFLCYWTDIFGIQDFFGFLDEVI